MLFLFDLKEPKKTRPHQQELHQPVELLEPLEPVPPQQPQLEDPKPMFHPVDVTVLEQESL